MAWVCAESNAYWKSITTDRLPVVKEVTGIGTSCWQASYCNHNFCCAEVVICAAEMYALKHNQYICYRG